MNDLGEASNRILDTKIKIVLAVWHITQTDETKYASRREIISFIAKEYQKTPLKPDTVRRLISEIQENFGSPFEIVGKHIDYEEGNVQNTYRIKDNMVKLPKTAYTLLDLATHGAEHQYPVTKKTETIKRCATELNVSEVIIEERIAAAIESGYIKIVKGELEKEEFEFTDLFKVQRPYLEQLALIAAQRVSQATKDK